MNNEYTDIMEKIAAPPLWFDEHAVPRYCDFAPTKIANIYAEECCLMEIACRGCERTFLVAMSADVMTRVRGHKMLSARGFDLHYGDPPNVSCCASGPTMNSDPKKVIEFWRRIDHEWTRAPELEIELEYEEDPPHQSRQS